jgi:3-methyladenine DNA glycosylase AlkD
MHLAEPLSGLVVRRRGHDVEIGMRRQQAQQLTTGVAASTGDRDSITHASNYAQLRKFIQTRNLRTVPADRAFVQKVRDDLRAAGDSSLAPQMQAYMKSAMPYLGVAVPVVRAIVRAAAKSRPPATTADLAHTALTLWREAEYREERYAATALTDVPAARKLQTSELLPVYGEMITSGAWWDHVDEVSHRVGGLLAAFPDEVAPVVAGWARADDRWLRRSSVICQIGHKDATDLDLLARAIVANIDDRDFFLRKAIGWALRDYARTDADWVRCFIAEYADRLSPLSRREALKHLAP